MATPKTTVVVYDTKPVALYERESFPAYVGAGILLATGGYAYFEKKSLPSLVGSSVLASLFLGSAYHLERGNNQTGNLLGSIASVTATGMVASRLSKTKKKQIYGVYLLLGLAASYFHLSRYLRK